MKKLITILFLFAFNMQAQFQLSEDFSFKTDKQAHLIVASGLSASTFFIAKNYAENATRGIVSRYDYVEKIKFSKRAAIIFPTFPIMVKEMVDMLNGGEISLADIVYGEVGLILTANVLQTVYIVKHKRQIKKAKKHFDIDDETWSLNNIYINKNNNYCGDR